MRTCVATNGERAAVAELARTGGWLPVEMSPRDGVLWADGYRIGESVAAVYLTAATDAPPDAPPGLPVILRSRQNHCLVALRDPAAEWRQAATVLDASDQLTPLPPEIQPSEGAGRDGALRYYSLAEQRGVVTIREDRALGVLEISAVRGLTRDAE